VCRPATGCRDSPTEGRGGQSSEIARRLRIDGPLWVGYWPSRLVVADLTLDRQMTSDTGESRAGAGLDRVPFVTPAVPPFRKRQFTVSKREPMAAYWFGGLEGRLLRLGESGLMSTIG
jgi:hypothetical protein